MTADVRTFKAANMQAALDIVRAELGEDAVILHTRQIDKRRLLPFFGARREVEITAGIGPRLRPTKASTATVAAASTTRQPTLTDELAPPPPLLERRGANGDAGAPPEQQPGHRRPMAVTQSPPPRNTVSPPRWTPHDVIVDAPSYRRPATEQARSRSPDTSGYTIARAATAKPPDAKPARPTSAAGVHNRAATTNNIAETANPQALHQRLDTLQRMILELGRERPGTSLHDIPTELFQVYTQLLDAEVDEDLARELVYKAKEHAGKSQLGNPAAMQALLTGLIEQELRVGAPLTATRGRRRVVALVGPTGVGKTTTLAKLAANLRLRDGLKVGLITVDTYRIAAVEQLKTYAELIDLPMKVVTSPDEMRRALEELQGLDLVLIDTAGRSPRDELKIRELKECLDAAQADEVHLVLSLASGLPTLETVAANFKAVGVTALILTKLDESAGTGLLLQIARQFRTPVSYLTTGQNVPDDIEPAHRTRMARLVLGLERLGQ